MLRKTIISCARPLSGGVWTVGPARGLATSSKSEEKSTSSKSESQAQREKAGGESLISESTAEAVGAKRAGKKTVAELDEELRLKLEGISGEGGADGVEYEGGKAVGLKRGVRENMFRVI